MPPPSHATALLCPRAQMRRYATEPPALTTLPLPTWAGLVSIAVGGSAIYGASLSLRFPGWRPAKGALWLALSAGLGWCVFGPSLLLVTRRNAFACAHACLVTMAYGEAVLLSAAAANLLQSRLPPAAQLDPLRFNLVTVGLSNVLLPGRANCLPVESRPQLSSRYRIAKKGARNLCCRKLIAPCVFFSPARPVSSAGMCCGRCSIVATS